MMARPIDGALVAAAQRGEPGAIEQLLTATKPDLQRFARRLCAGPEDAEDAVQNALWIMRRRLGVLRAVSALASWTFRVVARECRRMMRRAIRWATLDDVADIAARAVPLELRRDLVAAIDAQPPDYRVVLIMRDIEERTAPETADALGITTEAVKSRLHRARDRVRERLLAGGYFDPRGDLRGDSP